MTTGRTKADSTTAGDPTCAVTGATGYLGAKIVAHLQSAGIRTLSLSRKPGPGAVPHVPFALDDQIDPDTLRRHRVRVLVHCAYDFRQRTTAAIRNVNVEGTRRLVSAARAAGVECMIVLSSMSAFAGCRSTYGRTKLEVEDIVLQEGGIVLRSGLVFGTHPGGMFGILQRAVDTLPVLPVIGGRSARLHLVLDDDLCRLIAALVEGKLAALRGPLIFAHPVPLTLREILARIARLRGRRVLLVPFSWQAAWLGLGALERIAPALGLRSDSVISLLSQEEAPRFDSAVLERISVSSLDDFVAARASPGNSRDRL